ncbi:hypothetical protein D3C72_1087520 [compost metagenome]
MLFKGARNSWLMPPMKRLLARLALSAASLACCNCASVCLCASISRSSKWVCRSDSSCATRRLSWASTSHQATTPPISNKAAYNFKKLGRKPEGFRPARI